MIAYEINIAEAHTLSDWRGLPAHRFLARVHLDESVTEDAAFDTLDRLKKVYPWPEYHVTLNQIEKVRRSGMLAGNAPASFLRAHGWTYATISPE